MIPLFYPPKQNVDLMIKELRDSFSGRWWGQGPKVDRFEREFGRKFGFKYCTMTNSGTMALTLAYSIIAHRLYPDKDVPRFEPDDEVIVPVLTCTATCHPLKMLGAKIVFVDICPMTLNIDVGDVYSKVTAKTKAVVTVHLGGYVNSTMAGFKRNHPEIPVVEDAAQALGASRIGFGDFVCFSFQAIKSLTTGDGGMLVCKRKDDHLLSKRQRWFDIDRQQKMKKNWQAWDRRGITFDQRLAGYKGQPTDIDASIGLAGLKTFDRNIGRRKHLVEIYRSELEECKLVSLLDRDPGSSNWLFMVLVNWDRDLFAEVMLRAGIETNVAHIRNDLFTVFGGKRERLAGMNAIEKEYLCLPLNDWIREKDVRYICTVIRSIETDKNKGRKWKFKKR